MPSKLIFLVSEGNSVLFTIVYCRLTNEHTKAIDAEVTKPFLINVKMLDTCLFLANFVLYPGFYKDGSRLFCLCLDGAHYLNVYRAVELEIGQGLFYICHVLDGAISNSDLVGEVFVLVIVMDHFLLLLGSLSQQPLLLFQFPHGLLPLLLLLLAF